MASYLPILMRVLRQQRLRAPALRRLQDEKLRRIVRHAAAHVRHYRERFAAAGLDPDAVRGIDDLPMIPITTKDDLRDAVAADVVADTMRSVDCGTLSTSGTTGQPLRVFLSPDDALVQRAMLFRTFLNVGMSPRDRLCMIGPPRRFRRQLMHRLGLYRTDSIPPSSIDEVTKNLLRLQPSILWIQPTWLRALVDNYGLDLRKMIRPRLIVTTGEVLDPALCDATRAIFDVPMFNSYGAVECGMIAIDCDTHQGLHLNADHLLLETLGPPNAEYAGGAEVLVTALDRFAMPLIRYRLGDYISLLPGDCACGSALPRIAAPHGRMLSPIRLPSGRSCSPMVLQNVLRGVPGMRQFQIVQERTGKLRCDSVFSGHPSHDLLIGVEHDLRRCLAEPVEIELCVIAGFPPSTGKFKVFVQEIAPESGPPGGRIDGPTA